MSYNKYISQLKPSKSIVFMDKAKQLKAKDPSVISLAGGEPDFDTPQRIKDELFNQINKNFTHYTVGPGLPDLRNKISEKLSKENGCNYFGKTTARSCPFAFYYHSDVVRLAVDLGVHIPSIYGEVKTRPNDSLPDGIEYYTTGEQRTGCSMCGFGIQLEERPHRFDRLFERNPQEWEFWMNKCVTDEKTGEKYGWGRVLDYIGIEWRDPEHWYLIEGIKGQTSVFDWMPDACPREV